MALVSDPAGSHRRFAPAQILPALATSWRMSSCRHAGPAPLRPCRRQPPSAHPGPASSRRQFAPLCSGQLPPCAATPRSHPASGRRHQAACGVQVAPCVISAGYPDAVLQACQVFWVHVPCHVLACAPNRGGERLHAAPKMAKGLSSAEPRLAARICRSHRTQRQSGAEPAEPASWTMPCMASKGRR